MKEWKEEMIEFEATPQRLRDESVTDFCKRNNVSRQSYYNELSRTETKKRILEITLNKAKDKAPDVLDVLVQKAEAGDMKAMDIYIDSILKLAKNLDIKSDGKPIVQIVNSIADKYGITNSSSE